MISKHIGQIINCSLQTWIVGMFYLLLYLLEEKGSNVNYSEATFDALGFTKIFAFQQNFFFLNTQGREATTCKTKDKFWLLRFTDFTLTCLTNFFCIKIDRRKAPAHFFEAGPLLEILTIAILRHAAGRFQPAQNLNSDYAEWSCVVVITTSPRSHNFGFSLIFRLDVSLVLEIIQPGTVLFSYMYIYLLIGLIPLFYYVSLAIIETTLWWKHVVHFCLHATSSNLKKCDIYIIKLVMFRFLLFCMFNLLQEGPLRGWPRMRSTGFSDIIINMTCSHSFLDIRILCWESRSFSYINLYFNNYTKTRAL